ncbi:MAG: hypothetical protein WDM81_20855 [Rhizomicrobium sp.]
MLIDLVADHHRFGVLHHARQGFEFLAVEDAADRVERRVDQDGTGLGPDYGAQVLLDEAEARRRKLHALHHGADGQRDRTVGVIGRLDQHDLVALPHQAHDRGGQRLGGAGRDQHLRLRIEVQAMEPLGMAGDGAAQLHPALHRRILVRPFDQRARRSLAHGERAVLVREALAEIDRAVLHRQGRHVGEDGRGEGRENRIEAHELRMHQKRADIEPREFRTEKGPATTGVISGNLHNN